MNAENFSQYIENASMLYQMNYEELKQLILQYPFNANLHYLLAKKSHQQNLQDFDRNLKVASINSPDRARLYQLLHGDLAVVEKEVEERLELKSLQELDLQTEKVRFYKAEETPSIDLETSLESPLPNIGLATDKLVTSVPDLSNDLFSIATEEEQNIEAPIIESESEIHTNQIIEFDMEENTGIAPKEEDGVEDLEAPTQQIFQKPSRKKRNLYQKPKLFDTDRYDPQALQIVHQSVADSEEIATETLAHLLTNQQQFEKAIEVYERLTLLFPEKSDFFASRIQEIRKQMNI